MKSSLCRGLSVLFFLRQKDEGVSVSRAVIDQADTVFQVATRRFSCVCVPQSMGFLCWRVAPLEIKGDGCRLFHLFPLVEEATPFNPPLFFFFFFISTWSGGGYCCCRCGGGDGRWLAAAASSCW